MQGSREIFVDSVDKLEEEFRENEPKRGEFVVVVASDIFVQEVHWPASQIRGLSLEEVRSAFHYEVEPFSGFALDKVEVAYSICDDSFWVSEIGKDKLEVIRGLFVRYGCSGVISPFVRDITYEKLPQFKLGSAGKISARRWWISGIVLFLLLLFADYLFLWLKYERKGPDFAKLSAELERNGRISAKLERTKSRILELKQERDGRIAEYRRIEGERDCTLMFLEAIGEAFSDRAVLEKIENDEVYAVSPSAKEAIEAWEIVAHKVDGCGFRIGAPKLAVDVDNMAHFTFRIEEVK